MTGALALLLGAALVCAQGHRVLLPLTRCVRIDPHVTMAAWLAGVLGVVVTTVAGVTLLGLPGHGDLGEMLGRLDSCWSALAHGVIPPWEQIVALAGALTIAAFAVRLAVVAVAQTRVRRSQRERYRFLLAVVASKGLRQQLSPRAVAATLEHERAHLRERHQLILDLVDALAVALPIASLFRTAPIALRVSMELAADNAAVRRCGTAAVAEALRAMTTSPDPGHGLAMAGTATARRLRRLESGRGLLPAPARSLFCLAMAVTSAALPAFLGLAALLGTACSLG
ncbi:M56 family metallopeptidase [Nakamurella sp. PAMC28650]|uniref:M56 family metallopeptidase n=1 Tax=Nakamurella sp. PAMC28650 TaxID=2762325 RepID=UPI00164D3606|nr:M56 family metallopeptidase [Nakamurella sp. PAMC28650]QNK81535.1 M56 family metallopeptidase [Nakamurella sp. PAMC28650]